MDQEDNTSKAGHSSSSHNPLGHEGSRHEENQNNSVNLFGVSIPRNDLSEGDSSSFLGHDELSMFYGRHAGYNLQIWGPDGINNGGNDMGNQVDQPALSLGNPSNQVPPDGVLGFQQIDHSQGSVGGFPNALTASTHLSLDPPGSGPSTANQEGFNYDQVPPILPSFLEEMTFYVPVWAPRPDAFDVPPVAMDGDSDEMEVRSNDEDEMTEFDAEGEDLMLNIEDLPDVVLTMLAEYLEEEIPRLTEEQILAGLSRRTLNFMDLQSRDPDEVCPICLEHYAEGEEIGELMDCHHVYHVKCIKRWLLTKNICPYCNAIAVRLN